MPIAMTKPLADLKADATNRINKASDGYLERAFPFLYASPMQIAAFRTTVEECKAYIAAGYPSDLTSYPYLSAAHAQNSSYPSSALADGIVALYNLWASLQAQITLGASSAAGAINSATSANDIYTAEHDYYATMDALWT